MRVGIAVLASAFVFGTATVALAQSLDDIINQLPAIAQSGIAKLAESEWKKLPSTELDCINQKLRERGDSSQSFAQRGIFPFDSRVAEIRSQCRSSPASTTPDQSSAQTNYAVDGIAVGSRLKLDSAAYRDYKCSPSEQFDGLTWCQRARNDQERRGAPAATYSILHAHDGSIVYVNRFQERAFFGRNEADKDIQQYSRKIGEAARITKMPHRAGLPDGMIALWGATTLEQLDQDSIKILAEGKSPRKGLLVDFIGNFTRSAKEGLPVYRIGGGAGSMWAASFDQAGRGTLRFAAVDASGLSAPLPGQAPDVILPVPQQVILPVPQQVNAPDTNVAELRKEIETLRAELAKSADKVSQLEKVKGETERQARLDAESARREITRQEIARQEGARQEVERTKAAEDARLNPLLAQLEAEKAALDAKGEILAYGAIIGFIALLTILASVQLTKWRKATKARHEPSKAATGPLLIETHSPEGSGRSVRTSGARELDAKDGDGRDMEPGEGDMEPGEEVKPSKSVDRDGLVKQLAETLGVQAPMLSLLDLPPASSDSVVPESAAKTEGERDTVSGEETKPGKSLEQGDLALAETPGVQPPALSLSDLAPAVSDSVVPGRAAKSDVERDIEPGKQIESSARPDRDESAKQRDSHQLPS
jgi:hypothetical protein